MTYRYLISLSLCLSCMAFFACTEEEISEGDIVFYTDRDRECGQIDIQLENQGTQSLSSFFTSGFPSCEEEPEVIFQSVPFGNYTFEARGDVGCTWSGSILLDSICVSISLEDFNYEDKCAFTENESCLSVEIIPGEGTPCGTMKFNAFLVTNNCSDFKEVYLCHDASEEFVSERFQFGIQMGQTKQIIVCGKEIPNYKLLSANFEDYKEFNCSFIPVSCN